MVQFLGEGCTKEVISPELLTRSSVSAKSRILAKRSLGPLASVLLTTCSTAEGIEGTISRKSLRLREILHRDLERRRVLERAIATEPLIHHDP